MINQTHYVIDLETMGKGPRAAIVAIGCVRIEQMAITGRFYARVSLASAMAAGLQCDASTIEWWLQQSEAARGEITAPGAYSLKDTLHGLATFLCVDNNFEPSPRALLWGNGSSFDNVILGNAFDAGDFYRPWHYWNDRDLRTILSLYPDAKNVGPFEGTKHNALDDASHEAKQLCKALRLHESTKQAMRLVAGEVQS